MSQKSSTPAAKLPAERVVSDICSATRKLQSAEDKIRIIREGLRGEESIAALCRREAIADSLYYAWSKEFVEAGKRRLAGDTARAALATTARRGRPQCNSSANSAMPPSHHQAPHATGMPARCIRQRRTGQ